MAKKKKAYNKIKEVLDKNNKTQTWLAEQLDVDFVTISRYANNHNQPPLEVFGKIAALLGVKIKDLLND